MQAPLDRLFTDRLPALLPGFEPRGEQREMARAVGEAIEGGRHLAVEAGTGVGKSLAYLLPAALWAVRENKRVVVATYTRALQQQLTRKDLPIVAEALKAEGHRLRYALLMGSENYLCLDRLARARHSPELGEGTDWDAVWDWTPDAESGLRSRLPEPVTDGEWSRVRREADLCPGRKGPFWDRCLYRKDLARARKAHLTVVNQHLLFAGLPLPPHDALIIDEAHNIDGVAARFLGFSLGERQLKRLLDDALRRGPRNPDTLEECARRVRLCRAAASGFFRSLADRLELAPRPNEAASRRVRDPDCVPDRLTRPLADLAELLSNAPPDSLEEELDLRASAERCLRAASVVRRFLDAEGPGWAYWAEARRLRRSAGVSLHRAPIEVAPALRESLFGDGPPVIAASATLTVGGSFSPYRASVGLDDGLELKLESPFDFARQAILHAAEGMPDPKAEPEAYERAVIERCGQVAALCPGGVFLLFTSRRLLARAHAELSPTLDRPVFRQGEAPPYDLLRAFRKAGNGVLFGTDTFWQGVDIAGDALACVVITRLPFLAPDSPLEEARQEHLQARGENVFGDYTLPRAVIRFRQGVGRLIRSKTDRGAVVVLDPRLRSRSYGKVFRRSLPPFADVETIEELAAFLRPPAASPAPGSD